ncbi:NTP transferase domain-containing protein [Comamonas aquatica]|uniref:NTP transferase domain-containing protein n=1 Tax=Comamonas aquatica TaxID=225991 RepID=UPI002447C54E|nr:NTP transferase domain-containing protein [Comamonas aquatica]MDH1674375.1 NTP transferase domain-containing protein [Comamonas aquatica]MDH1677927.1 NTP transferase domain-containing protein [Comamonas aquatica]
MIVQKNLEYIVLQAGGKGSRLGGMTKNKPKALVPYENLPIIFHLFQRFSGANFIIIGDYHVETLKKYLQTFARERYVLLESTESGNIAGIAQALQYVPEKTPFVLTWCDLIIPADPELPVDAECAIGITDDFACSWRFDQHGLVKVATHEKGVMGLFIFKDKQALEDIPCAGSFTTWLATSRVEKTPFKLPNVVETGSLQVFEENARNRKRCRPYNHLEFTPNLAIKTALTPEGEVLLERERIWFQNAQEVGFTNIPKIYGYRPLTMERIQGDNIYCSISAESSKQQVLSSLVNKVKALHACASMPARKMDLHEEYFTKTLKRLQSIAHAIPFASEEWVTINGRRCRNVLRDDGFLLNKIRQMPVCEVFHPIHGDCTLTNTLISEQGDIYFIDARGYFGKTQFFGDADYDWAKLYYSIVGNFDKFNEKFFTLSVNGGSVEFKIESNGWEHLENFFFSLCEADRQRIKTIHAIIWLSLASHCWEDYDSMCVAYYNGLYILSSV